MLYRALSRLNRLMSRFSGCPGHTTRPLSPSRKFRPTLESLDARIVPTVAPTFEWTNATGDNSFTDPANWTNVLTGQVATSPPPQGSSLTFDGTVSNANISGVQGFGHQGVLDFNSITLTNGYTGTMTFASNGATGITVNNFTLASGAISQPTAGTDLTVLVNFSWTGGTLNSSTNLANVNIDGSTATATFAPASGGTVNLGSNINIDDGAQATMQAGTIDTDNGIQFTTNTGSSFFVNPGTLGQAIIQSLQPALPPMGVILPGTSWTLSAGSFTFGGSVGNSGTVTLMPGTVFGVTGDSDTNEGYVQWGSSSATYLQGGSTLVSPFQPVLIQGGTLATVWSDSASSGTATIDAPTTTITGGDIYVSMQQGSHIHFGALIMDGNVQWEGGTYHPYVYSGGTNNDVWQQINDNFKGTFTISGGTVAPVYLDSDYGTSSSPTSGTFWEILQSGGGFANNTAPSVSDTTVWSMQIDPFNPPIYWQLVAN